MEVFHTDIGDIISLLALETAAEGGVSKISSSWRVYNHLAENRPDLIETLSQPWANDTCVYYFLASKYNFFKCLLLDSSSFGSNPKYIARPLLAYLNDKLIIQYARRSFTGFEGVGRSAEIPPITEAQAEALDALHFIAEEHALSLNFQKGDIQYVNNLSVFHARDGFRDDKEHT